MTKERNKVHTSHGDYTHNFIELKQLGCIGAVDMYHKCHADLIYDFYLTENGAGFKRFVNLNEKIWRKCQTKCYDKYDKIPNNKVLK